MTIEDRLRARGDWLGASCVPRFRDLGMLFAARFEGEHVVLSGIGGKVEKDETFLDAALREYHEEAGEAANIDIVPVVGEHLTPGADELPVPPMAAGLARLRPAAHPSAGSLWITVYLGRVTVSPIPVEKVKAFAIVDPRDLTAAWFHGGIRDLLCVDGHGIRTVGQIAPAVRGVKLVDTATAVLGVPGLLLRWWLLAGAE